MFVLPLLIIMQIRTLRKTRKQAALLIPVHFILELASEEEIFAEPLTNEPVPSLANSNITWEQTDEFNYGLDLGLFNNRINLAIDAYYSVTRALLFEQPTQSFTGYTHYWNNIGKVRNSGLEIQLDTHNMKSPKSRP